MFVSGDSSKFFDPLLLLIFYEITRHSFEVCRISNLVLEMVDGAAGGWKPALCVVVSEVFNTGTILLSKVAIDWGTFVFSLLLYRSILGAVFTLPFALFFERSGCFSLICNFVSAHYLSSFMEANYHACMLVHCYH